MDLHMNDEKTPLSNWMADFLAARGLARPDGRPLYAYKSSDDEFIKITKQLLLVASFRGIEIFRRDQKYDALFVLFAAEWWRREYRGGPWAWEPVFQAIGLDDEDIQQIRNRVQQLLYPALERGFKWWRREIFTTDSGRAFIGSIAAEGGLPLNLLTDPYGGLKRYFKQLLNRYLPFRTTGMPVMQIAEELKMELPVSFRNPTVYRVAGDIIAATLDLRAEYGLAGTDDPVSHLDRIDPTWKDRFPLVLDSEPAQALLRSLVTEVVNRTDSGQPLTLSRSLIPLAKDRWRLQARVAFPRKLSQFELASLFGELVQWPGQVEVWLLGPFRTRLAVLSRVDADHYRVRSEGVVWYGERASDEVMVGLYSYEKALSENRPLPESLLDSAFPWVFTENEDRLNCLGQGGMRIGAEQVTIALPEGFELTGNEQPPVELGKLESASHRLFRGSGILEARCDDGSFVIRTREARVELYRYELTGQRLYYESNVRQVFIGMPRLFCRDASGAPRNEPSTQLQWRYSGSKGVWSALRGQIQGVIDLKLAKAGELVFRGSAAVLPAAAEFRILPSSDLRNGRIRIQGLPGVRLASETDGVAVVSQEDIEDGVLLSIHCNDPNRSCFNLQIQWPDQPRPLTLRLPVPIVGSNFRGSNGDWLTNGAGISLEELPGVSAVGFGMTERLSLDIEVRARDFGTHELRAFSGRMPLPKTRGGYELALIQLRDRFRQIFAMSEDLDCEIRLNLVGMREYNRLTISRYHYQLQIENNHVAIQSTYIRGVVGLEQTEGLKMELHSLLNPDEPGQVLEALHSEGVHTGQWRLPDGLAPGPWLAMTASDQDLSVRPAIVPVAGEGLLGIGGLREAISIAQAEQRRELIGDCIKQITADYCHPDWRLVTDTLQAFGHLPATTLDLWNGFVHYPHAMAMLLAVIDLNNSEQVLRMAKELPFSWQMVSFDAWLLTLSVVKEFVKQNAPEGMAQVLIEGALEQKLALIGEADPVLSKTILVLRQRLLGRTDPELKDASILAAPGVIEQLIESASGELRSQHGADEQWPPFDGNLLADLKKNMPARIQGLFTKQAWYMEAVLQAPIAMACLAGVIPQAQRPDPSKTELYQLRQIQDFAPEWYREAFGLTTLYIYATNSLYETGAAE